jgi:hypothetical protein
LLASVLLNVNKHNCATTPVAHAIKLMQIKDKGEREGQETYMKKQRTWDNYTTRSCNIKEYTSDINLVAY